MKIKEEIKKKSFQTMLLPPASTCQEGYPVLKHELSHQKVDHPKKINITVF